MILKTNHFILLAVLMFLMMPNISAQTNNAIYLSQTADSSNICHIKWYHEKLINTEGANIYRHEAGSANWIKLNNEPIKYGKKIPEKDLLQDKTLNEYIEWAKKVISGQQDNIAFLSVLLKSIESAPYARHLGIQYDDVNLASGKSYEYRVMLIKNGQETELGISTLIYTGVVDAFPAPQNIEYKTFDKQAAFKWKPEPEKFFSVNVYRKSSTEEKFSKINKTPVLITSTKDEKGEEIFPDYYYYDDNLKNDQEYEYVLKAVNYFGKESQATDIFKIIPGMQIPPPAPANLKVTVGKLQAQLNWSLPQNMKDVAGFNVYRNTTDKTEYKKINQTPLDIQTLEYEDILQKSGGYYYYVTSINKRGLENKSNKVFADVKDVTPPAKPKNLTIKADTGRIILRWDANTDNDLMGYRIYRKIEDQKIKEFVPIVSSHVKNNYFIDTIPKNVKNRFLYQVAAIDSSLNISERANATAVSMPDVTPPVKPFIKKVLQQEKSIVVEWIPNYDTDLMGYNVFRSFKRDSVIQTEKINTNLIDRTVIRFVDRWAEPGIKYYYHIVAIDSIGNRSDPSEVYSGIIKPESLTPIIIKEFKADYYKKKKQVIIKCIAEPVENYKGMVIYKGNSPADLKPLTGLSTAEEFQDKEINDGNVYYYQAKIFDIAGNIVKSEILEVTVK